MKTMKKGLATTGLALVAVAAFAAVAVAHPVHVVGGASVLEPAKALVKATDKKGIEIKGGTFKVTGGEFSFHALNDGGGGTIEHKGKLAFKKGKKKVKFTSPIVDVPVAEEEEPARAAGKPEVLATLDGEEIVLGELNTKSYEINDEEPGFSAKVKLGKDALEALKAEFGGKTFEKGMKIGVLENVSEVEEHDE